MFFDSSGHGEVRENFSLLKGRRETKKKEKTVIDWKQKVYSMIKRFFDGEILGIVAGILRFQSEGECAESLQAHKLKCMHDLLLGTWSSDSATMK